MLAVESEQVYRNPVKLSGKKADEIIYTEEQRHAIESFRRDYADGKRETYTDPRRHREAGRQKSTWR